MLQQFTPAELRALVALREEYEAEGPEDAPAPPPAGDARMLRIIERCATAILVIALILTSAFVMWCVVLLAQLQR